MELARLTAGMIIWYTIEQIQAHLMRPIAILLLARHNDDAKKAATALKCRANRLIDYLSATPLVEQSGPAMVLFNETEMPTTMDGIEIWIRVETIRAAQALLAVLRSSTESEPDLVRPAARLLGMEDYDLRRDLAKG